MRAKIINFKGLSAHADHDHLVQWVQNFDPKPQQVFVVHGDEDIAPAFAEELRGLGFAAHAPKFTAVYDLALGVALEDGYVPERRKSEARRRADVIYNKLATSAEELLMFIKSSRGMPNKDMAALTSQIHALLEKWK